MTWNGLATRLSTLPRVLAGPMLRKVTPMSVTVWFALRVPAKITVRVWAGDRQILSGDGTTCAVGRNLHVVAVTADFLTPGMTGLGEGAIYCYDAVFDFKNGESGVLLPAATGNASLSYGTLGMPSFALPPRDINRLRLLQGSCRRPYSGSRDMLPFLDGMIEAKADKPFERPHQLLLTGDQIYADDVSDALRIVVTDAADALLGWDELLPMPPGFGNPRPARDVQGPMRWAALKVAGITSDDLRSHLMSLGEYLSMYLLVWSPVLWPTLLPQAQWRTQGAPGMPAVDDVRTAMRANAGDVLKMLMAAGKFDLRKEFRKATVDAAKDTDWIGDTLFQVALFQSKLVETRRALANVPSYMIFDDHEITDDWNMTRSFCNDVYGSALGIQMVQNGLVAFCLCQHWGNVPQLFKTTAGTPPAGARLLAMMDTADPTNPASWAAKASQYASRASDLRRVLAVHDAAALRSSTNRAVFHDGDALRYDFTVECDTHQVIFTDTRTWRAFPPDPPEQFPQFSGDPGTHLLSKHGTTDQFKTQIVDTPPTNNRLLFVVLTTNAPPTQGIRSAERHSTLTHAAVGDNADLYEAWDLPSESFDRLLTALTSKLPVDGAGNHRGTVVILSGDVHHSFASRIGYRATQRYEDDTTPRRGAAATIVQLVGSGIKNVETKTIGLHEDGYFYRPHIGLGNFIRDTLTEAYVGFSFPANTRQNVGTCTAGAFPGFPIVVNRQTIDVSEGDAPWDRVEPRSVKLTVAPHYRYRLDYLVPQSTTPLVARPQLNYTPGVDSFRAMSDFSKAVDRDKRVNPLHCVGVGNLCELAIVGTPQPITITHRVLWWDEYTKGVRTTTYVVPAGVTLPNDPVYPDIKAAVEPP